MDCNIVHDNDIKHIIMYTTTFKELINFISWNRGLHSAYTRLISGAWM